MFLCEPQAVYGLGRTIEGGYTPFGEFSSRNTQPGTSIYYWLKTESKEKVKVVIQDPAGRDLASLDGEGKAGLNVVTWRPRGRNLTIRTGDFSAVLKIGDKDAARVGVRVESLVKTDGPTTGSELGNEVEADGGGR